MDELACGQLDFENKSKTQIAIARIQAHEPPEGYWLAFSGGKDSCVILHLAKMAGVKFKAHYSWTGVDPPELFQFIKAKYPEVEIHRPEKNMWQLIAEKKILPLRTKRFCCEWLKERVSQGQGYTVMTGIRWAESIRRNKRRLYEVCQRDGVSHYLHPIIDWTTGEVWDYIRRHDIVYSPLYDEGFDRIGCILCPMSRHTDRDIKRWPKVALAYQHAAERIWKPDRGGFKSGSDYYHWWLSRDGRLTDEQQCLVFEDQ